MPDPRSIPDCGTIAGARRHYKLSEPCCPDCLAAQRDYQNARTRADPYSTRSTPRIREAPRNGLAPSSYRWRARTYPWAIRALHRAEATHGRPPSEAT